MIQPNVLFRPGFWYVWDHNHTYYTSNPFLDLCAEGAEAKKNKISTRYNNTGTSYDETRKFPIEIFSRVDMDLAIAFYLHLENAVSSDKLLV